MSLQIIENKCMFNTKVMFYVITYLICAPQSPPQGRSTSSRMFSQNCFLNTTLHAGAESESLGKMARSRYMKVGPKRSVV